MTHMTHSKSANSARAIAVAATILGLLLGCTRHKAAPEGTSDSTAASAAADTGEKGAKGEKGEKESGGEDAAPQPVVAAKTAVAAVQPFTERVTAIGVVASRPGSFAEMSAPAPTRVARVFVAVGDRVAAGAPLVEFERAPFDAAAAAAEASLTAAQRNYERATRLAEAGIVPKKDVDQAAADLASVKTAAVSARLAQERGTIHAPIAGVVTHLSAILGASVDPSQAVVGVADPTALDVVLSLSSGVGAQIRPGSAVTIATGQDARGEVLGTGTVTSVGSAIDTGSRGVPVRARITRPARVLRIGQTVFAQIAAAVHPHAVVVPVEALVPDSEGFKVFVVDKDGIAHARSIVVGGRTERLAEITQGVQAGETVVTEGAYGVEDGAKIVAPGQPAETTAPGIPVPAPNKTTSKTAGSDGATDSSKGTP
jgi:membrane fusion protein (multidrug efflux system)